MPINLGGGYGAGGVADSIRDLIKQRLLEQELADRQEQTKFERLMRQQEGARADKRLAADEDAQQFTQQKDTLAAMQGQPMASIADMNTVRFKPATGLPDLPGTSMGGVQPPIAPRSVSAFQADVPPVNLGGRMITPQTAEQAQDEAVSKAQAVSDVTPRLIGENDTLYQGGRIKAIGMPRQRTPANFGNIKVSVNGKNIPALRDPSTGLTYDARTRQQITDFEEELPEYKPTDTGARDDSREDRSYQFARSEIERLRKPVVDASDRLDRIDLTVAANTPQADSLIAPELLTAMAGGQGSGLRMNESEIARIVGGRSNWESIKAAVNKWQLDPKQALSVTPAQRKQIVDLLAARRAQVGSRMTALNQAGRALSSSHSVDDHRRIIADLDDALSGSGGDTKGPATGGRTVTQAQLAALAARRGTTAEQEAQRAAAEGFTVVR